MTTESISFELGPGERLLWSGFPRQGLLLRPTDLLMIPFSLLWGGFAIFWEMTVLRDGAPLLFALWGVPFVIIGLYITLGRFFYDALRRRDTFYGLTDQRAIIAMRLPTRSVRSFSLASLTNVVLDERANGVGTIVLGPTPPPTWSKRQTAMMSTQIENSFDLISDAKHVFDLIREAQRQQLPAAVMS